MKVHFITLAITIINAAAYSQLVVQPGAELHIQQGADIYVQGNINSRANITGHGNLQLNGESIQEMNMNGFTISNLVVNNAHHILMTGNTSINNSLSLLKGNLQIADFDLNINPDAVISGGNLQSFIETNGLGKVRKNINSDLSSYTLPIGTDKGFAPLDISTNGKYGHAFIEANSAGKPSQLKPVQATDYLNNYWSVNRVGITGTVNVIGHYNPEKDVTGNNNLLSSYYWDGLKWIGQTSAIKPGNTVTAVLPAGEGQIFAMKGIGSAAESYALKLLPNPAISYSNLGINTPESQMVKITLRDAAGKEINKRSVWVQKGINWEKIQLQGLANGNYTIDIESKDKKNTLLLIKR
jgi:hypothetical protein